jgi:hypothetical protein
LANARTAESLTACLGSRKGRFRARGDHPSLKLSHGDHLLQQEAPGCAFDLRKIGEPHVNARFQQAA